MNLETRVANAVATNDMAEFQALANEGYMLNKAPAGARTMSLPSKLELTEKGVVTEPGPSAPFTPVVTDAGTVHVAVVGTEVHVWAEG